MQKFFCDNCGAQVDKDTTRCPKCGRFFQSIKCPKCGFSGNSELFTDGCPVCGYAGGKIEQNVKKDKSTKHRFSERFYKIILPVLLTVFIILVILLFKAGW
ncbi:MAG: zinc-ribbon domain-containing protein [Spirochaetales bacterium]|nr:zinc-ribbon domain-containing protein [Spirochaetales bacterium]